MIREYHKQCKAIQVFTLYNIPSERNPYLRDPKYAACFNMVCYDIESLERYTFEYDKTDGEERLTVHIVGRIIRKNAPLVMYAPILIQHDNRGYVCVYYVYDGSVYTSEDGRIRIILHGGLVRDRMPGDQLGQEYQPPEVLKHGQII